MVRELEELGIKGSAKKSQLAQLVLMFVVKTQEVKHMYINIST